MLDGLFQNFTTAKSSPKIITFSSLILKLLTQLFFFFCIETLSSPKRDGVDKSVTKNSVWVEDLDNNLPINPSQLSLFQTVYMCYGIRMCSLCSENMLALHGILPDGMQTSSKKQAELNYQSTAVEQYSETHTERCRGILRAMFMHKHYKANQRHLSSLPCLNYVFSGPRNN